MGRGCIVRGSIGLYIARLFYAGVAATSATASAPVGGPNNSQHHGAIFPVWL